MIIVFIVIFLTLKISENSKRPRRGMKSGVEKWVSFKK
jgi:hypothetical protein